ncbi:RNA polymerase sigma factor [Gorillibacterium timonense]|uniref:RNA polymerase sigma factor n=1 Tax=Gorillibacterium timonense TaxID=1689269 RepID=UPI00071CD0B5|nr:sigma-70 family RNA polymerase sigma factor [Gorillibacterium timonense]
MLVIILSLIGDEEDRRFMTDLYRDYYPLMKKKAYEVTQDYRIVDDLIQDACMKLIPKIPLLRSLEDGKRIAYVVYTVKNTCVDFIRKRIRDRRMLPTVQEETAVDQLAVAWALPEPSFLNKENGEELGHALRLLSDRDRQLLICKYHLEWKDPEIARYLEIPVRHVPSYLTRAKRRACALLSGERRDHREEASSSHGPRVSQE